MRTLAVINDWISPTPMGLDALDGMLTCDGRLLIDVPRKQKLRRLLWRKRPHKPSTHRRR